MIPQGVHPLGGVKQGWGEENSPFRDKSINISKTIKRYVQCYY